MPELPPPIPPHLQPPEPKTTPSLAGVDYRVTLLDDSPENGCLTMLLSIISLFVIGFGILLAFGRLPREFVSILLFGSLILVFVAFYASLPLWVGLGSSPALVRITVVVLLCVPFFIGGFEGFLSGVLAQVIFSVPFWIMRLFRWRIKSANQLTIFAKGQKKLYYIPIRQTARETDDFVRRRMQSTTPDGPLDAFKPAQFSILQMIVFTTAFGIVAAFLRLAQEYLSIFNIRGMQLVVLAMMYGIIVAMQILALWTMLASINLMKRYLASIGIVALLWIGFFIVIAILEGGSTTQFFEALPWMLIPTTEGFILLCGILSIYRNMGYRLIRLQAANTAEKES